jgi:hypothetical protein
MGFRTATQAADEVKERTKPGKVTDEMWFVGAYNRKTDSRSILKAIVCNLKPEERVIHARLEDGT